MLEPGEEKLNNQETASLLLKQRDSSLCENNRSEMEASKVHHPNDLSREGAACNVEAACAMKQKELEEEESEEVPLTSPSLPTPPSPVVKHSSKNIFNPDEVKTLNDKRSSMFGDGDGLV